jgi:hypothetical protein
MSSAASAADLTFSPASLVFPNTALGESGLLKATLTNNTGLNINLTSVTLSGTNAANFTQTNTCPNPLPTGQRCVFSVTFKPALLKANAASLTITTNDPTQPNVVLPLSGNLYPKALNDTGITTCGDVDSNGLPCPVTGFRRQDAEYGRDKLQNNNTNGHAGFNFTKLDASGRPLPASATTWNCVRDNVTGLVWEKKPVGNGTKGNQGLHDADDTYTWYSTDASNNGGSAGYSNQGNTCYGYNNAQPSTWCNTEAYVQRVNAAGWCGARDWRLPTREELRGLVDLSIPYPGLTIDTGYFPDTIAKHYWSSSPVAYNSYCAWIVHFGSGYDGWNVKDYPYYVRVVRGGQ